MTGAGSPLLADYRPLPGRFDEMLAGEGRVRPHWEYLVDALGQLGPVALHERRAEAQRQLDESGVTYTVHGDPGGRERAWKLDPLPMLVSSAEWHEIERGLIQRAELMNLVFRDLYGDQQLIRRGILPAEAVYAHSGFLRACHPLNPRSSHPLSVYAADLVRGSEGRIWVLGDRIQVPSGAGYALVNRITMARVLPSLFRDSQVHRLALFFQSLRASLAACSPRSGDDPRIVVLTPGPLNETYFEHAYLASYLGYTLARGDDLVVQGGRVWLRSMRGLEQVDVILRRVDDHYCDPLELRPDSRLGVPGLVQAVRGGSVAVVNPLGASVLENPALNAFLPAIARHLLGQDLILPSAASWWCGQSREREHVLANLDKLVIKPIYRAEGVKPLFGGHLTRRARERLAERIRARPMRYAGQEQLDHSVVPTLVDGGLEARHVVLRSFLVAGDGGYTVMPGGLTRVAAAQDSFIVSNQAGGTSKDTWILASEPEKHASLLPRLGVANLDGDLPTGTADNLFWFARYAERAEQGARLLRTVLHVHRNLFEYRDPLDRVCLELLLQVLTEVTASYPGFFGPQGGPKRSDPVPELLELALEPQRAGGVASSLWALMATAYSVRDRVSGDTWRVINAIRARLEVMRQHDRSELGDVEGHLDELVTSLVALAGFSQESMLRGQAWLFLDIGRRLERAQQICRLLRASTTEVREADLESLVLDAVLAATESATAYRRGYQISPSCEPAFALLLFDESSPRSLAFQLGTLQGHLALLPGVAPGGQQSEQMQLVCEALTRLHGVDPGTLSEVDGTGRRATLISLLDGCDGLLRETAESLTREYFTDLGGAQQLIGGG